MTRPHHLLLLSLVLSHVAYSQPTPGDASVTPPSIESLRLLTPHRAHLTAKGSPGDYHIVEISTNLVRFHPHHILPPAPTGQTIASLALPHTMAHASFRLHAVPLDHPADTDGDGIDDFFEILRPSFLNPLDPDDAHLDADLDGYSNLEEYLAGTEPIPSDAISTRSYPTLDDLRATFPAPVPALLHLDGYERAHDGWGGWFRFDSHDIGPADDAIRVALRPGQPGRLERVLSADATILSSWWRPKTDGSANAAPSLQAAFRFLQESPYWKFQLLPGRYRINAVPTMFNPGLAALLIDGWTDFEIDATGATLFSEQDGDILVLRNVHRGRIRGLSIEGPGSDRALRDISYAAIQLAGINSDLLFERCRIRHFMHGISHLHGEKTSVRVTIRECLFEDGGDTRHATLNVDGAAISGVGDDWLIEGNFIHECARGIEIENTGKTHTISRVLVRDNRLTHVRNMGIMSFMGPIQNPAFQQSDIQVVGNLVYGKPGWHRRPDGSTIAIMNITLNGGQRIVVSENTCDFGAYAGISVNAVQGNITEAIVANNLVSRMTGRGIQMVSTPSLRVREASVHNNRVRSCYDRGILLGGDAFLVQGNVVDDCGVAGIAVENATEVILQNNVIRNSRPPHPAIFVHSSSLNSFIVGNTVSDAAVGIENQSTSTNFGLNHFFRVGLELTGPE